MFRVNVPVLVFPAVFAMLGTLLVLLYTHEEPKAAAGRHLAERQFQAPVAKSGVPQQESLGESTAPVPTAAIAAPEHEELAAPAWPDVQGRRFANITPTGFAIFNASLKWMDDQRGSPNLIKEATCALNVSQVLGMADPELSSHYGNAWAPAIGKEIKDNAGVVIGLGKTQASIVKGLGQIYSGYLPTGSIITACYSPTCGPTAEHPTGARHVAIVGEQVDDVIYIHHNNYYRPMKGERWKSGMISQSYLSAGIYRQWQRSPWLRLVRNRKGEVVRFVVVAPSMLRIMNPYQAHINIAIPREIVQEIDEGRAYAMERKGTYRQLIAHGTQWIRLGPQRRPPSYAQSQKENSPAGHAGRMLVAK